MSTVPTYVKLRNNIICISISFPYPAAIRMHLMTSVSHRLCTRHHETLHTHPPKNLEKTRIQIYPKTCKSNQPTYSSILLSGTHNDTFINSAKRTVERRNKWRLKVWSKMYKGGRKKVVRNDKFPNGSEKVRFYLWHRSAMASVIRSLGLRL